MHFHCFFLPGLSLEPSATAIGASGSSVALLCISNPDSTWDRACFWIGSRCSEIDRSPYDLCLYRLPPAAYTSTFKYQRVLLILRLFSPNNAHIQGELLIFWYCFFWQTCCRGQKGSDHFARSFPTAVLEHFGRLSHVKIRIRGRVDLMSNPDASFAEVRANLTRIGVVNVKQEV